MTLRVAIAGAGLAGLACAKYLTDAGCAVTVYEAAPILGGRAATWRDDDGQWVEAGLHGVMGEYVELLRLLRDVGREPEADLAWHDHVRLHVADGPRLRLGMNPVTAPLDTLAPLIGRHDFLDPLAKLSLVPLLTPGALPWPVLRDGFDTTTVTAWWRQASGHPQVLERVLRPLCRALQLTEPEDFSAYDMLGWIHHVAWALPWHRLGAFRGARQDLVFAPLADWLHDRGTPVHTRARLRAVAHDARAGDERWGRVAGFEVAGHGQVEADAYVLALPAWLVQDVLPPALADTAHFGGIARLPTAPAISVQLWFDRPFIGHGEFTLLSGAAVPLYQDQAGTAYPWARGSRVSLLIAPADAWLDRDDPAIIAAALQALRASEPGAAAADVVRSAVIRHPAYLVRPLPGAMSARPPQATPVPNLFLAGDWTQQPFFGSQEGAVRGGKAAAGAIMRAFRPQIRVTWLEEATAPTAS